MTFQYLNEEEVKLLGPLIPEEVLTGELKVIALLEEEILKGFAVVGNAYENVAEIRWLYVLEKYRRKGYAAALVAEIAEELKQNPDGILTAVYETEGEASSILDRIFAENGFEITCDTMTAASLSREEILNAAIMEADISDLEEGHIYPLEDIEVDVLEDFFERHPDFIAAPDEIVRANGILSVGFGVGGRMTGLVLVQDTEDEGVYIVSNIFYDDSSNPRMAVKFVNNVLTYVVAADQLVQELEFPENTDFQKRFLAWVFGESGRHYEMAVSTAILTA